MNRQLRIRPLLTATLLVFALLPTLLFGLIIVYLFSAEVSRGYTEHLRTTVTFQTRNLVSFFNTQQQQLQAMLSVPMLREFLQTPREKDPDAFSQRQTHLRTFLAALVDNLDLIRATQLVDRRNMVLASSRPDDEHKPSSVPVNVASLAPGRLHVTPLCQSPHESKSLPHFWILLPIVEQDVVVGALACALEVKAMEPTIRSARTFATGNVILFDNQYNTVVNSLPERMPTPQALAALLGPAGADAPRSGWLDYTLNGEARMAYYTLLPDIHWGVLSSVSTSEVNSTRDTALAWLVAGLLVVSPVLLLVAWVLSRYLMQDISHILKNIRAFRAGTLPLADNVPLRTELAVINTALRELMEALNRSNEEKLVAERQFRFALEQTHQLVFEVNLTERRILTGEENWNHVFSSPFMSDYTESLGQTLADSIHPEDREAFERMFAAEALMTRSQGGMHERILEFRCKNPQGAYRWYSCSLYPMHHEDTLRGIVCIKDIHDRKVRELEMEWQARKDSLTGLYNKRATQNAITGILESSTAQVFHAMFIVDLDNFKSVNDTLGHQAGDALLQGFAGVLQSHFRDYDIVGRIGGDEFMVLLKDYPDQQLVQQKAQDITRHSGEFFHAFLAQQHIPNLRLDLGVSIGIALYVRDGDSFASLYSAADAALYAVKKDGKHAWRLYEQ